MKHKGHLAYSERLKRLNLTTLYYRRQRADVLQMYQIIYGIDKLDRDIFFQFNNRPYRGNSLRVIKPMALLLNIIVLPTEWLTIGMLYLTKL